MQRDTDLFKKLNNHRLPIDESYWAEMEERLQSGRKKFVPLWAWFAGAGVAASLTLLLMVRTFHDSDDMVVGTQMTQMTQIAANNTTNETLNFQQVKNPRKSALSVFQKIQKIEEIEENNEIGFNDIAPTEEDAEIPVKQYELKSEYIDLSIAQIEPPKRKSQKKKSWQIAAAVGSKFSNSDLAYSNENSINYSDKSYFLPGSESMRSDAPSIDEIFQPFPEVTHLPPLSVGLSIRKDFNKYLAVETGLTYSFLQSKFNENNERMHREATMKLHYIGIPFNAVVYILNKPKWNLYFSLGGMVEKGMRLDYVQNTTYPNYYSGNSPIYTISLQDNIPELQWSLNTSLGISYQLYRDLSVYFEPRILYYFKNNQPVSIRSEMPLLVGANVGLRVEI